MVVSERLQLKVVSVRGAAMAGDIHDQYRLLCFTRTRQLKYLGRFCCVDTYILSVGSVNGQVRFECLWGQFFLNSENISFRNGMKSNLRILLLQAFNERLRLQVGPSIPHRLTVPHTGQRDSEGNRCTYMRTHGIHIISARLHAYASLKSTTRRGLLVSCPIPAQQADKNAADNIDQRCLKQPAHALSAYII